MFDGFLTGELTLIPIDNFIKPVTLILTKLGLNKVLFEKVEDIYKKTEVSRLALVDASSHIAGKQFTEYFNGKRFAFDLKLDISGTPFQRAVWNVLMSIPYGQTLSYKQVAELAGVTKAYRATGNCCGQNPLPVIIPCHRVLKSGGGLGGYGGGLDIKEALLRLETVKYV